MVGPAPTGGVGSNSNRCFAKVSGTAPHQSCYACNLDGRRYSNRYNTWALSNGCGADCNCKDLRHHQDECRAAGNSCKSKHYVRDRRCYCTVTTKSFWAGDSRREVACEAPVTTSAAPCSGDDCRSTAICPNGEFVSKCASEGVGDGPQIDEHQCVARGSCSKRSIKAIASCSTEQTSVVVSNAMYHEGEIVATCPTNQPLLGCCCDSSWTKCGQTSFTSSSSECKQTITSWVRHSRRGTAAGAEVKVYALCKGGRRLGDFTKEHSSLSNNFTVLV